MSNATQFNLYDKKGYASTSKHFLSKITNKVIAKTLSPCFYLKISSHIFSKWRCPYSLWTLQPPYCISLHPGSWRLSEKRLMSLKNHRLLNFSYSAENKCRVSNWRLFSENNKMKTKLYVSRSYFNSTDVKPVDSENQGTQTESEVFSFTLHWDQQLYVCVCFFSHVVEHLWSRSMRSVPCLSLQDTEFSPVASHRWQSASFLCPRV